MVYYRIAGNFWRENFQKFWKKPMISENIFLNILCFVVFRDGSLEVPHAEATQYNEYLFRMFA